MRCIDAEMKKQRQKYLPSDFGLRAGYKYIPLISGLVVQLGY